jgi:hypothetical protein
MSGVNGNSGEDRDRPDHLAYLLNRANRRLRAEAKPPDSLPALSVARARILDVIPATGCRIVDLSAELLVSKQGLGQLVWQLTADGFLAMSATPLTAGPSSSGAQHAARRSSGRSVTCWTRSRVAGGSRSGRSVTRSFGKCSES